MNVELRKKMQLNIMLILHFLCMLNYVKTCSSIWNVEFHYAEFHSADLWLKQHTTVCSVCIAYRLCVCVCVSLLFFVYFHFFIALRKIFVHRNINASYEMTTHFTFKLFREVESASRIFSVCVNRTQWSHNICTMAKIHRNFNSTKNTTAVERRQRQENGKQQKIE